MMKIFDCIYKCFTVGDNEVEGESLSNTSTISSSGETKGEYIINEDENGQESGKAIYVGWMFFFCCLWSYSKRGIFLDFLLNLFNTEVLFHPVTLG